MQTMRLILTMFPRVLVMMLLAGLLVSCHTATDDIDRASREEVPVPVKKDPIRQATLVSGGFLTDLELMFALLQPLELGLDDHDIQQIVRGMAPGDLHDLGVTAVWVSPHTLGPVSPDGPESIVALAVLNVPSHPRLIQVIDIDGRVHEVEEEPAGRFIEIDFTEEFANDERLDARLLALDLLNRRTGSCRHYGDTEEECQRRVRLFFRDLILDPDPVRFAAPAIPVAIVAHNRRGRVELIIHWVEAAPSVAGVRLVSNGETLELLISDPQCYELSSGVLRIMECRVRFDAESVDATAWANLLRMSRTGLASVYLVNEDQIVSEPAPVIPLLND